METQVTVCLSIVSQRLVTTTSEEFLGLVALEPHQTSDTNNLLCLRKYQLKSRTPTVLPHQKLESKRAKMSSNDNDDEPPKVLINLPCASHLGFSTLTNESRRVGSWYKATPNNQDPYIDALMAADELAAIALGADPAFMTVSSGMCFSVVVLHGLWK